MMVISAQILCFTLKSVMQFGCEYPSIIKCFTACIEKGVEGSKSCE
jgi:hypothetical protein